MNKIKENKNKKAVQKLLDTPSIKFSLQVLKKQNLENLELTPENLEVLKSHGLENWAYENIPAWRPALKTRRMFLLQRAMSQLSALIKIKKAFEAENIDFIVLKGLPLSMLLYGDYTIRQCVDLDLFVSPDQAMRAHILLQKLGYVPLLFDPFNRMNPTTSDEMRLTQLQWKDVDYYHREESLALDCHWRLIKHPGHMNKDFDFFLQRSQKVQLGPESFKILSSEDLFIHLCLHGISHHFEKLGWLVDIDKLLDQMGEYNSVDWKRVIKLARSFHALASVLIAFRWREIFFNKTMPTEIKNLWDQSWTLPLLIKTDAAFIQKRPWARSIVGRVSARVLLYPSLKDIWFDYRLILLSHHQALLKKYYATCPKLTLALCYFLEPVIMLGRLFKYSGQGLVRFFHRFI